MSIQSQQRVVYHIQKLAIDLKDKYKKNENALLELTKLNDTFSGLEDYLHKVSVLQTEFNEHEIRKFMESFNLHMAILKVEIDDKDYAKLAKGMKIIQSVLKFHPHKSSFVAYIIAWFTEWFYVI